MGNDWIIHVLSDLQSFAKDNDLPLLAVKLEQTALVASAEIRSDIGGAPLAVCGEAAESRSIFTTVGSGRSA